jgi:hypothetical protein
VTCYPDQKMPIRAHRLAPACAVTLLIALAASACGQSGQGGQALVPPGERTTRTKSPRSPATWSADDDSAWPVSKVNPEPVA